MTEPVERARDDADNAEPTADAATTGTGTGTDADFQIVAASPDVAIGTIKAISIGDADLVVWRTADGEVRACEARCPHQWNHLAAVGQVEGDEIVCAVHYWRFDAGGRGSVRLLDGARVPTRDIAVHQCRERDGQISVRIA